MKGAKHIKLLKLNVDVSVNFTQILGRTRNTIVYRGALLDKTRPREVAIKYIIGNPDSVIKEAQETVASNCEYEVPIRGVVVFPSNGAGIVMDLAKLNFKQWRQRYAKYVPADAILYIVRYLVEALIKIVRHGNLKEENILLTHDSPYLTQSDILFSDKNGYKNDAIALGSILLLLFNARFVTHEQQELKLKVIINSITMGAPVMISNEIPEPFRQIIGHLWKGSFDGIEPLITMALSKTTKTFDVLSKTIIPFNGTVSIAESSILTSLLLPSNMPLRQISTTGSKFCDIPMDLLPRNIQTTILKMLNNFVTRKDGVTDTVQNSHIKKVAIFQSQSAAIGLIRKVHAIAASYEQSPSLFKQEWRDGTITIRGKKTELSQSDIFLMDKIHSTFFEYVSRAAETLSKESCDVYLVPVVRGCSDYDTALKIGSSESRDLALLDDGFIGAGIYYTHDLAYASRYCSKAKSPTRAYLVELIPIRDVFPVFNMSLRGQPLMGNVEAHYSRMYKKSFGRISYYPLDNYKNYVKVKDDWVKNSKADIYSMFGTYSEIVVNSGSSVSLFAVEVDNIFEADPKKDMTVDLKEIEKQARMEQQKEHLKNLASSATPSSVNSLTMLIPNKQFLKTLILYLNGQNSHELFKFYNPINIPFLIESFKSAELQRLAAIALALATQHDFFVEAILEEKGFSLADLCSTLFLLVPNINVLTLNKTMWEQKTNKTKIETLKYLSIALHNILKKNPLEAIRTFQLNAPESILGITCAILGLYLTDEKVTLNCLSIVLAVVETVKEKEKVQELLDVYDIVAAVITSMTNIPENENVAYLCLAIILNVSLYPSVGTFICRNAIMLPAVVFYTEAKRADVRLLALRILVNISSDQGNTNVLISDRYSLGQDLLARTMPLIFKQEESSIIVISDSEALRYVLKIVNNLISGSNDLHCPSKLKEFLTFAIGCCLPDISKSEEIICLGLRILSHVPEPVRPDDLPIILDAVRDTYGTNKTVTRLLDLL